MNNVNDYKVSNQILVENIYLKFDKYIFVYLNI